MRRLAAAAVILFLLASLASAAERQLAYDVVVVGAGTGGVASAIAAARRGMRVAVVETTDQVGGQMVASAVSTLDDLESTRFGIYGEFVKSVQSFYGELGVASDICLWGANTVAVEPSVASMILTRMMRESGEIDIFKPCKLLSAHAPGGELQSLLVSHEGEELTFKGSVFIEATEYGDLIPLTGAEYRAGNSHSPNIKRNSNVQDITYVAVVRKYDRLPPELRVVRKPPGYDSHVAKFRRVITKEGNRWPQGGYPFDVPTHNAYRALPDRTNSAHIAGDDPNTWSLISKTGINWANDFPGRTSGKPGLKTAYLEDVDYRRDKELQAMKLTLSFIWYMQNELGMENWSVDRDEGYGGYFTNDWRSDASLRDFAPILEHFPPMPYVRESRRIVGVDTLTQQDLRRDSARKRALRNFSRAVALGEYPVDVHGSHLDRYMEKELGESAASFPRTWEGRQGVFQVPIDCLIPRDVDGLIAAEKNISVSRMASGATRLHPITMHTGQAAGELAAIAVKENRKPRHVEPKQVQRAIMESGSRLSLDESRDAEFGSPYWMGVQWASLSEALPKISRSSFGVNLPLRGYELAAMLEAAFPGLKVPPHSEWVTRGEFYRLIPEKDIPPVEGDEDALLERGEAVQVLWDIISISAENTQHYAD